ncbi:septum formation inhibitor Maf [Lacinutrix sp. C3R15]|uniref:septum formation inhibitor Maf n=1 Tax=Flavobacteriaceae TaxID=49546 RepID=UPI001C098527|nr:MULTISPECIES: septum formation inhibitor Maf [Flavobacteriaceae]MBU2939140.1 septum formation inhibitor Maf [Lacinutrix sp. C3R15]MDO6622456.1 septum formation inhibitor Maf [Oceanihabitans sp. 1_MG-2023]
MKSYLIPLYFILFFILSCKQEKNNAIPVSTTNTSTEDKLVVAVNEDLAEKKEFNTYWYSGKAELSSYELKQSRYNEIRTGEVVLIFVTEPFSLSKQVKLDNAKQAGEDKVTVMKLNQVRKFNTGIYDYSIVTSTFTPIDFKNHPLTLKATTSIQEWCGHTFTQLNLDDTQYNFKQFSYFEADGDASRKFNAALLEEDLMARIRIQSGQLPVGELQLIPSTIYSRFNYKKMQAHKAKISKTETETALLYTIRYLDIDRSLSIQVEKEFPYKILEWTEGDGDGLLTTATLKSSLKEPYWNQKSVAHEAKREALKLIK